MSGIQTLRDHGSAKPYGRIRAMQPIYPRRRYPVGPAREPDSHMPKKAKAETAQLPTGTPMPARVEEDEDFLPLAELLEGKVLELVSIAERVEEEAKWWDSEPLFRMHYQITLEDGQQVAVIRNMKPGGWYRPENPPAAGPG